MRVIVVLSLLSAIIGTLGGCGTGTAGAVPIGPDTYMIGRLGNITDYSASSVKARLYGEAGAFCVEKGRVMSPLTSTGQDSGFGTYASAEVQFLCLRSDDPRLSR
jgi:hypothetical protein